jgi:hypothetical protein
MKAVIVVSDLHCGSSLGLTAEQRMPMAEGGGYDPSRFQLDVAKAWKDFFKVHVPKVTRGAKKRVLCVNGDIIDGAHHNTVALATNNLQIQETWAISLLKEAAKGFDEVYCTLGTEAHTQPGGQSDERIAVAIGAVKNDDGMSASWQQWLDVDGIVINIAHHIGTTSSAAYESSAVMREMVAALVEAGQWEQRLPDVIIRSHRHRFIRIAIPSAKGEIQAAVSPGWQLRTPYVERIDRMRLPHIGGLVLLVEDKECLIKAKIYPLKPTELHKV